MTKPIKQWLPNLIVVDVGNTHTKIFYSINNRIFHKKSLLSKFILDSSANKKDFLTDFLTLISHTTLNEATIILCSVVPTLSDLIKKIIKKNKRRYFEITPYIKLPFLMSYKTPQTLGMDRLCLATYAWSISIKKSHPVIIVGAGTATTIDVVTPTSYLGGLIQPSPNQSLIVLSKSTAQLPLILFTLKRRIIGDSTQSALVSGVLFSWVGGVKLAIQAISEFTKQECSIIFTGGSGKQLFKLLGDLTNASVKSDSLILGAQMLYEFNFRKN